MTSSPSPCEFPRCTQAAQFCFVDEPGVARFCTMHKDDTMVSLQTCEFPRCSDKPIYTFTDDISNPHFCAKHKSHEMVLVSGVSLGAADATAAAPATPSPTTGPSQASLELAYNYFSIKPEYDALESAKTDAAVHQAKLDNLKSHIKGEVASIHKTSQSIEKLEKQISCQEGKILNCFGKSLFGYGLLMKDQSVIDKKMQELKITEAKKAELDSKKAQDDTSLAALQAKQARLDELVDIRDALEARVQELRSTALEYEGTTDLRRLQSQHQTHERMQESLQWCRKDVATAHQMFQKSLNIQAVAARSNAMAAGVNIGQAIGGGGGRGLGNSPGERLLQIRRNQATKQSIELAKQAADKLNVAQNRLNNDLRVHFHDEMQDVGIIEVPDLWSGNFFRDLLVGQAAGNIGDAVNQGRAMGKIRKNMQELELMIAACAQQMQSLQVVSTKLDTKTGGLKSQVFTEEKRILHGIIEAAKKAQADMEYA